MADPQPRLSRRIRGLGPQHTSLPALTRRPRGGGPRSVRCHSSSPIRRANPERDETAPGPGSSGTVPAILTEGVAPEVTPTEGEIPVVRDDSPPPIVEDVPLDGSLSPSSSGGSERDHQVNRPVYTAPPYDNPLFFSDSPNPLSLDYRSRILHRVRCGLHS